MASGLFDSEKMVNVFKSKGHYFPSDIYAKYGASSIEDFCSIIVNESSAESVNPYVVFAQAMLETGWLRFGGRVNPEQCNFAGIGAVDNGSGAASFNTYGCNSVRYGLRAQIQHLKAYGSRDLLVNKCIDPRFKYVKRGSCPFVSMLGGKWASDINYGVKLNRIISSLYFS